MAADMAGEMAGEGVKGPASILFTAFEPSGDAHAASVIRELRRTHPKLRIYGWGGTKMEEAGATIVERTTEDAVMGMAAATRVFAVRRQVGRVKRWARGKRLLAHVAVDAPAANFPICRVMRKAGAHSIHLVAPQLWAWGRWRLGKLRRLTSMVLCVLPFEEEWFRRRRIPARFIGHPAMNRALDADALRERMHGLPQGAPRIAIFPGSRAQEVRANLRLLLSTYIELQGRHAGMGGIIVAANPGLARIIRKKIKVYPTGLHMITGDHEAAIGWCDLALAVSGTITLEIARQRKPMIGVYKTGWLTWFAAMVLIRTRYRLLPNIIANREIVPEFVPHARGSMAIVTQATRYLHDSRNSAVQSEELARVCLRFANKRPAQEAAALIMKVVEEGTERLRD